MLKKKQKCVQLMEYIDALAVGQEFKLRDAVNATSIPKKTIGKIVFPLSKADLLYHRPISSAVVFYSKTPTWTLDKAIKLNRERMRAKYLKYYQVKQ